MQCPVEQCIIKMFYTMQSYKLLYKSNAEIDHCQLQFKSLEIFSSKERYTTFPGNIMILPWWRGNIYHIPGQHHDAAPAQRGTCDPLPRGSPRSEVLNCYIKRC